MKKILSFLSKHIVSTMLVIAQIVILIPKAVGALDWHWALVFIPSYLFAAWWIILISIGAYLTKRDEAREREEQEESGIDE